MTSHRNITLIFCCALLFGCRPDLATIKHECTYVNRLPVIKPDYSGITIPPNIAPVNFSLQDSSASCIAEISTEHGSSFVVQGDKNALVINPALWKKLLAENPGNTLQITIYSKSVNGSWKRYSTIENYIAAEPVDRYCTYRLLTFQYNYSSDLRECQRDLTSFNETILLNTQNFEWGCVNCHTPLNNDPGRFVLQVRSNSYGSETLIADGNDITTLSSRLGYAAWHPDGKLIAFSVYKVKQYFHAVGRQFIDVCDQNARLVIYDVDERKIIPVPHFDHTGVLETWPAWSPDGRFLYYCSAPIPPGYSTSEPPKDMDKVRFALLRLAYDPLTTTWGNVDTVLSPAETGLSIAQPKLSPDNRFCLFTMQNYGAYPHTQVSSDLYIMDVGSRQYRKLPVNSEYNECWHSWSKNGRWILFSSKRNGGIFTRLYLSYIDSAGNVRKPFLLPQRDPAFYDSFLKCYNVAEFATAPVRFSERQLLRAIRTRNRVEVPVPANTQNSSNDSPSAWGEPSGH
jgi:hypothetical protein